MIPFAQEQYLIRKCIKKACQMRMGVLRLAVKAGAAHITSSFSCIDILTALYFGKILRVRPQQSRWSSRDRFILSKGHAALALYTLLADLKFFSRRHLKLFAQDGSLLGIHPEECVPGVDALTGSLGHGLSIGAGIALAGKLNKKRYLTYVLLGDGECHEGAVWEAAMFAAHHNLNNLVAIIDYNRLSATDFLEDCLEVEPLKDKWEAFGWETVIIDGHSFSDLLRSLSIVRDKEISKPLAVIAVTRKGRGVSFMENIPIWHYRAPNKQEFCSAMKELSMHMRRKV